MPTARPLEPKWGRPAQKAATELAKKYKDNLKSVAKRLAHFESAESILIAHVNSAHEALARLGLSRRRWRWQEMEFWLSGLLLGGSISLFTADWHLAGIAVLILGTATAVHAWTIRLQ